jgi:hypothetical protein
VVVLRRTPRADPWRVAVCDGGTVGERSNEIDGADVVIKITAGPKQADPDLTAPERPKPTPRRRFERDPVGVCFLHLDAHRDLNEYVRENCDTRAVGAFVTHRRCGAKFRDEFAE